VGCGFWGVGCGVWGLGFGVFGVGSRVPAVPRDPAVRQVDKLVLNLRTTTSQKCAAVPRQARI